MKNFTIYKSLFLLPLFIAILAFNAQAQCPTIPNATYSSTDITCFGANDGTVTVELGDGTGPFNYFLFDLNQGQFLLTATKTVGPANKVVFSDLPASDYIVQVRKPGCANINIGGLGITVNEPPALVLDVTSQINIAGCFGEATGSFQVAASGGNGGYTYSFNGGAFGATTSFTNLAAGIYTVEVRDANNCVESVNVTITEPAQLAISLTSQSDPDCNGNTTGSIVVAATGGTPAYEFSVNGGAFTPGSGTFSNLAPGSYNIQVRDSKGCTASLPTVTLTNPPILAINLTSKTDITTCFGDATGEIVVAATGGTPAYEFSINGGAFASASSFTNLIAGSYSIQVKDANGCTTTLPTVTITQPTVLAISLTSKTDITSCFGDATGEIVVSASGGTPVYEFSINGGAFASASSFTSLTAGSYSVQVRDSKGCITSLPAVTISQPTALQTTISNQTNPTCFAATDGEISLSVSGGTSPYTYSVNGSTFTIGTGTFSNLSAGSYSIQVRDANGCFVTLPAVTLTQPAVLVVSLTSKSDVTTCFGDATGEIVTSVNGGTSPYTYSVNGGAFASGSGTFSNLAAGNYNIQVRDANGCTTTLPSVTISQPTVLAISLTSKTDITSCFGDATGEIVVSASGGTPVYEFSINGGAFASASSFTSLTAGSYSVQVRDSKGCITSLPAVTISQPIAIGISLTTIQDVICNGGSTGSITVSASGGTPAYQYSINGGAFAAANVFNNLTAGAYTIQVKDSKGCVATLPATIISEPAILTATLVSKTDITGCFGDATGIITVSANGGTPTYEFSINGGAFASAGSFTNLAAGTYNIQARDANGCTASLPTVTISQPVVLTVSLTSKSDVTTCFGDATGEIVTSVSGGTIPYTYSVNGGAFASGSGTFSNLAAGTYNIQVRDASGCTTSLSTVTINQPAVLSISLTSKTDITGCNGDATGSITVLASGGTPAYEFSLNGGTFTSTNVFNNLTAGTYTIQVKDAKNCIASLVPITINQPVSVTASLVSKTDVSCNSGNDGSINISVSGGTSPYAYSVNGAAFASGTGTFSNLSAGTYTIQVRDANNCTATLAPVTIIQPSVVTISLISKTDVTGCFGDATGSISVSATGGTPAYEFSINGGAFASASSFTNLSAGTYNIQMRDSKGCMATLALVTINQPATLTANLVSKTDITTCFGDATGSISVSATGGTPAYEFSINGGAFASASSFTNLTAGSYSVQVRDSNGCTTTLPTVTITQPTALAVSLTSKTDITGCFGDATGSINVSASGGTPVYEFSINGGAFASASSFTSLTAGSYSVQVRDSKGCITSLPAVTISQPTALQATISNQTNPTCFAATDGEISLSVSGGTSPYTYSVNGSTFASGTGIFSNLSAGIYSIQVRDANGCFVTLPAVTLTQPALLVVSLTSKSDVTTCFGDATGEIVTSVNGGASPYTYSVNGGAFASGSGTFSNLSAGTYNIQVRDANNCTASLPAVTITQPTVLAISLTSKTDITTCFGDATGEIVTSVIGGTSPYTYSVNGGSFTSGIGTFANLIAGIYSIQVKDASGCTASLPAVTISQPTAVSISLTSKTDPACEGNTSGSIVVSAAGGTSPYSYSVNGGAFASSAAFNNLSAGTYTIQVKDAKGCMATLPAVTLTAPTALVLSIASQNNPACNGDNNGTISVTATGGTSSYQYSINGGSFVSGNNFTNLTAGTYTITVKDANNCTTTLSNITLTAPAGLTASITSKTDVTCNGANTGNIVTSVNGGTAPYTYSINGGAFASGPGTFSTLIAGTYTITVKDANGCTTTLPVTTIAEPAVLNLSITSQTDIDACSGINSGSITVAAIGGTSAYTYSIDGITFTATNTFTNLTAGAYTITVKDANNCTKQLTATITSTSGTLTASEIHTDPTCNGATDGSITVNNISGGSGSYEYSLDGTTFQNGSVFNGLSSGSYTVTVKDKNATCSTTLTVTLSNPVAVNATIATVNPNACTSANGSITITASGGTSPYTFAINGGTFVSGNSFTNLAAGSYAIIVKDANGCTFTIPTATLTAPSSVAISLVSKTDILCAGSTTGNIIVSASGGTAPYQYSIDGTTFASSATFNNLAAGPYSTITVKDANGCIAVLPSVTITEPAVLAINLNTSTNPSCGNANGGSIIVSVSGGVSPYTYSINGGVFTAGSGTFNNLTAGSYTISTKDANGCTVDLASVTLTSSSSITATVSKTEPSACTATDGTISISSVNGGTAPYTYSIDGTNFVASSSFTGLAAGSYTITVKDASGCVFTSSQILTAPSNLTANFLPIGESGCNVNDGLIIVSGVSGAAGPYKYYINNAANPSGINNNVFISLAGGNYLLTIEAANGCSFSQTVTIDSPCACTITASAVATNIDCTGGNIGSLTVTASGGSGSLEYSLDGTTFQDSNNFSNLSAGSYTITIRDKNDITCNTTTTASITQSSIIAATVNGTNPTGCNTTDGSINVSGISGGTAPYTYSINGTTFQTGTTFNGLGSGSYTITIKDNKGCIITKSQALSAPGGITASVSLQQNVSCQADNDGSVSLNVSGGSGNYEYRLNSGAFQNGNSYTGLSAGNYTITVRDKTTACNTTVSVTITEPAILAASLSSKTDVTCFGEATGSISVSAIGGTAPYQYSIDGITFVSNATFNNLIVGNYASITVKDAKGCTAVLPSIVISQPVALVVSLTSTTDLTCNGANNGQIIVTATGGTSSYTYSVNGGAFANGTGTFNNLSAGTYSIQVKDASGCIASLAAITLAEPSAVSATISVTSQPSCNGSDGSFTVSAAGGNIPYTYAVNGGSFGNNNLFSSLSAGSYSIQIKDANGCIATQTVILTAAGGMSALNINASAETTCGANNGTIVVSAVQGGTAPYSYFLNGAVNPAGAGNNTFNNLVPAIYTILVEDANGCTFTQTITVDDNCTTPVCTLAATFVAQDVTCFGNNNGAITVNANGGSGNYEYSINGSAYQNAATFSGLTSGTYSIIVRDKADNTCTITISNITINEPALALSATANSTNITCNSSNDGTISIISVTGGTAPYSYSIDGGNTFFTTSSFSNLAPGTYNPVVQDANGCAVTLSASTLAEPAAILATVDASNPTACTTTDGSLTVSSVSGGTAPYSYSVDGVNYQSGNIFTGLGDGTYNVFIKDTNGCVIFQTKTLTSPSGITASTVVNPVTCNAGTDGTITINVTGGSGNYEYSENGTIYQASNTFANLIAGNYTITIRDITTTCIATVNTVISQPATLNITLIAQTEPSCIGSDGSISVVATGGTAPYTFAIDAGNFGTANTFTNLAAGTYTISVKDVNGCTATLPAVTLTAPSALSATVTTQNNITCNGATDGSFTLNVSGGTAPYTYSVNGGTFASGTGTFNNLSSGTYSVEVKDSKGCLVTATDVTITEPALLTLSLTSKTDIIACFGDATGSITVSTAGGTAPYQYSIDGTNFISSTTFNNLTAGIYNTITVKDARGCTVILPAVTLTQPVALQSIISGTNPTGCTTTDGTISLGAVTGGSGNYEYSIDGATFQAGTTFSNLSNGSYTIIIRDKNNTACTITRSATLNGGTGLTATATASNETACLSSDGNITVSVSGGTAPYQYFLGNSATANANGNIFSNLAPGTYSVKVVSSDNCEFTVNNILINAANCTPACNLTARLISTNVLCNGQSNGAVELIQVTGGSGSYEFSIDNGINYQDSPIFSNLTPGNYTITVRDKNNLTCTTAFAAPRVGTDFFVSGVIVVNQPPACSNLGGIEFNNVAGGTAPYTYSVDGVNFQSGSVFTNLISGTYQATIKDANNCQYSAMVTITGASPVTATALQTAQITCKGLSDAAITVTASGGIAPYQYAINSGAFATGSGIFSNLAAGTYTISVKDAGNCIFTLPAIIVSEPTAITAAISAQANPSCSTNDGSITITAIGGTGTLMYSKDNGTTFISGNTFTGLAAGSYTIQVKDANGCTITLPAVTLSLPVVTATLTSVDPNSCSASNGSLTVNNPAGGTAPYVYSVNGGAYQNSATFSGLASGSYTIAVRDAAGCEVTLTRSLTASGGITAITITPTAETACGANNGTITVNNITGAIGPFEYYIDGVANPAGINANVFTGLAPKTYTIRVVASNGCIYTSTSTVNANCAPSCNLVARLISTPVLCNGATDGTTEVIQVTGGSGSYEYSIDNGLNYQDSPVFGNLGSGVYTILVRDKNNKSCTASFVTPAVTNRFLVSGVIVVNQPKSCAEKGSIEFTNVGGGVAAYSFSIDGATFLSNTLYPSLDAGTYQATIKDANNCTFTVPVVIVNVPPIAATATMVAPVSCNGATDGKIKVENISGGTGTYVYSIDGTTFSGSPEFSNRQAGIHTIYVKDQNGSCVNSFQVTVTEPAKLVADLTTVQPGNCSAQDGELKLVVTLGGTAPFEYKLNNGSFQSSNTFSGLGGGNYTVTLRDAKGCTSTFTANLAVSNPISAQAIQVSPTSCSGNTDGIAQINVTVGSGVYEFSKDGIIYQASNTFTGMAAGNYILYAKDKTTACIASSVVTISGAVQITASIPSPVNPSTCVATDGKIQINSVNGGTGSYQFSLDSLNNFQSGSFPFEFTGLANGAYKVYIKDSKGCYGIYSFNLASPNSVVVGSGVSIIPATCKGSNNGKLDINPTGTNISGGQTPYEYSIDGTTYQSASLFTSLLAGTYTVRVKDASGCVYTYQYEITEPAGLEFEVQEISGAGCGETSGSVRVRNIQGGISPYSFSLNNIDYQSDSLFIGLTAGAYKMYVKDASGQIVCENVKPFNVSGATPITFKVATENIGCEGGNKGKIIISDIVGGLSPENTARRFSINGGTSFRDASGNEVVFDNLSPGIYNLVINYGKNFSCATTPRQVRIISSGIPFTIDTVAATCGSPNGSATAIIPGGGNYFYSIDSLNYFQTPKFENLKPGLYKMYVKESANDKCLNIQPFIIPGPDSLNYDLIKENCFDIRLTNIRGGVAPYKVSLNGGNTFVSGNLFANSYTAANLLTGEYNVVVVDSKGCTTFPTKVKIDNRIVAKVKATLSMPDEPTGEIRITDIRGGNAPYEVSIDGFTWGLVNDKSVPIDTVITTLPMGKYTVYVRDASGCVKEYETEIKESKFMIPNVFTPNGDGVNDTFFIRNLPAGTFVTISNRWGKIIYSSKDYQNDWNGGSYPDGIYYYSVNIAGSGQLTGWVQIWR